MLIRAEEVDANVRSDLCIIGGGAAGLTVAHALRGAPFRVCLLESGDLDYDAEVQRLYEGAAEGTVLSTDSRYLTRSRLRYFGGSTNHWTGYCRPLDAVDFSPRPWVPHSGWPFRRSALAKHYDSAATLVQIPSFDERDETADEPDSASSLTQGDAFITRHFHLSPPTRFAQRYGRALANATDTPVYLGANVVGIDTNEAGTMVERVRVSTLSGRRFDVRSRNYVLAAGGVENARLLLISDDVHRAGLGNDRDLVGRYFMEHPHLRTAGEVVARRRGPVRLFPTHGPRRAVLCPSESLQRQHGLLNCSVMLNFDMPDDAPPSVQRVSNMLSDLDSLGRNHTQREASAWSGCYIRAEQGPNPASRVRLSNERDALGIRRARLEWQMTPKDIDSIRRTMELLGLDLGRTGRGRARQDIGALDPWDGVAGGDHHMGTTRMSDTPDEGVVNPNCRVHGVANLYVAGSSVFPTAGYANPTLTIVALALRLAVRGQRPHADASTGNSSRWRYGVNMAS